MLNLLTVQVLLLKIKKKVLQFYSIFSYIRKVISPLLCYALTCKTALLNPLLMTSISILFLNFYISFTETFYDALKRHGCPSMYGYYLAYRCATMNSFSSRFITQSKSIFSRDFSALFLSYFLIQSPLLQRNWSFFALILDIFYCVSYSICFDIDAYVAVIATLNNLFLILTRGALTFAYRPKRIPLALIRHKSVLFFIFLSSCVDTSLSLLKCSLVFPILLNLLKKYLYSSFPFRFTFSSFPRRKRLLSGDIIVFFADRG